MTLPLIWTRRALSRLDHIGKYIARDNPDAADRVVQRIVSAATSLCDYPDQGRAGRVDGTRELVLADLPYIIAYRPRERRIEIITVIHTSQRWPIKP